MAVRGILTSHHSVSVWICSAGFGLVRAESSLCAYSATFSTGHPDSVGDPIQRRNWWQLIAEWPGPEPGTPRSFSALVQKMPKTPLLVAISKPYLMAISEDLLAARDRLERPELLSILCVGAPHKHPLAGHFLPVTAAMRSLVGGPLVSLNARLTSRLFKEHRGQWTHSALRRRILRWAGNTTTSIRHTRRPLSDGEVRSFIREELSQTLAARPTPLLRRLREKNLACEQKCFTRLSLQETAGHGLFQDGPTQDASPAAG